MIEVVRSWRAGQTDRQCNSHGEMRNVHIALVGKWQTGGDGTTDIHVNLVV